MGSNHIEQMNERLLIESTSTMNKTVFHDQSSSSAFLAIHSRYIHENEDILKNAHKYNQRKVGGAAEHEHDRHPNKSSKVDMTNGFF